MTRKMSDHDNDEQVDSSSRAGGGLLLSIMISDMLPTSAFVLLLTSCVSRTTVCVKW